jgi:hypothetical protein
MAARTTWLEDLRDVVGTTLFGQVYVVIKDALEGNLTASSFFPSLESIVGLTVAGRVVNFLQTGYKVAEGISEMASSSDIKDMQNAFASFFGGAPPPDAIQALLGDDEELDTDNPAEVAGLATANLIENSAIIGDAMTPVQIIKMVGQMRRTEGAATLRDAVDFARAVGYLSSVSDSAVASATALQTSLRGI